MGVCKVDSEVEGAFWGELMALLGGLRFFLTGITSGSGKSLLGRSGNCLDEGAGIQSLSVSCLACGRVNRASISADLRAASVYI